MRIISQDKTADYPYEGSAVIIRNRLDEQEKFWNSYKIVLIPRGSSDAEIELGFFSNFEEASEEMRRIWSAYNLGAKVYEVRNEEEIKLTSAIMRTKKKPVKIDLFEPQEEEMKESE